MEEIHDMEFHKKEKWFLIKWVRRLSMKHLVFKLSSSERVDKYQE